MLDAAACEWVCRHVAPADLGTTPVYPVPLSDVPPALGGHLGGCGGFTGPALDLVRPPAQVTIDQVGVTDAPAVAEGSAK